MFSNHSKIIVPALKVLSVLAIDALESKRSNSFVQAMFSENFGGNLLNGLLLCNYTDNHSVQNQVS